MVKKVKKYNTRKVKKRKGKKYKKTMKRKKGGAKSTSQYNKLVGCVFNGIYSNVPDKLILLSTRYINNDLNAIFLPFDIFDEKNKDKIPLKDNKPPGRMWYDGDNTRCVLSYSEGSDEGLIIQNKERKSIEMFGGNYESSIEYYKKLQAYYSKKVQDIYDSYTNNIDLTKLKQLESMASNSSATLPLNSNYEDETQKNSVMAYFKEKKCIEKCKEYLSIMKQKMNLTMTTEKEQEKQNIVQALKTGGQQINSVEGYTKSFGELYDETPWGSMGGKFAPTYDGCQNFSIISTVVDFAIRNNNKNICVPHGIDLKIHRKFSGYQGKQVASKNVVFAHTNKEIKDDSKDRFLCFPVQPSLSIRNDYKDFAWEEAFKEVKKNGKFYTDVNGPITLKELQTYKKKVQDVEKKIEENLFPVENLGSWYTTDFKKKIVSYKKNVDPNFNIPSKIRYAIERCLFNKEDLSRYNPDNICGIYLPLGVTTGIKKTDNSDSGINHANMVYIQKVSKDAQGKYKLKMYLFDPNYDPTFYLKNRLNDVIASINSSQNDYIIETEAIDFDMKIPIIFNEPYHPSERDVGIHDLFPEGWIGEGICGSVTWFIFILWSLVCKEIPNFENMYFDILLPLYLYKTKLEYKGDADDCEKRNEERRKQHEVAEKKREEAEKIKPATIRQRIPENADGATLTLTMNGVEVSYKVKQGESGKEVDIPVPFIPSRPPSMNICRKITMFNTQEEEKELEELYEDFLFIIWEFLKWSRDQLSDEKLFMLHLYKKKMCYLDTIIYKQEKYKV